MNLNEKTFVIGTFYTPRFSSIKSVGSLDSNWRKLSDLIVKSETHLLPNLFIIAII